MLTYRSAVEEHEPACEIIELKRWSRALLDPLAVAAVLPVVVQLARAWIHRADGGTEQLLYAFPWALLAGASYALGRYQSTTRLELDADLREVRIARRSWFRVCTEVVPYDAIDTAELRTELDGNARLVLVTTDGNEHLLLSNAMSREQELSLRGRLRRARGSRAEASPGERAFE